MNMEAKVDAEEINKAIGIGVIGSDTFVHKYVPEVAEEKAIDKVIISMRKSFDVLLPIVCKYYNVTKEALQGEGKIASLVNARSVFAYACHIIPGSSLGEACRKLGKYHGTMSKLAKRVENNPSLQGITKELLLSRE